MSRNDSEYVSFEFMVCANSNFQSLVGKFRTKLLSIQNFQRNLQKFLILLIRLHLGVKLLAPVCSIDTVRYAHNGLSSFVRSCMLSIFILLACY